MKLTVLSLIIILLTKNLFALEVPKTLNTKNCHPISSKDLKNFNSEGIFRNNIYINIEFYNYSKWIKLLYGAIGYSEKNKYNNRRVNPDKYKKNNKALITQYNFTDNYKCVFNAKIRFTGQYGDHLNHQMPSMLVSSIDTTNAENIKQFKLLRPETRNNSDSEIFNTLLFKSLGFLSPLTKKVYISIQGGGFNEMIFQENLNSQFLERNRRVDGPIIEFDIRCQFFWNNKNYCLEKSGRNISNGFGIIKNSKWSIDNIVHKKISFNALSEINNLVIDYLQLVYFYNKNYRSDWFPHIQNKNKKKKLFFQNVSKSFDKYYILSLATNSLHSLVFTNQHYYYDRIYNLFEPIYYDAAASIESLENINLINKNLTKLSPVDLKVFDILIRKLSNLNKKKFFKEIKNNGSNLDQNIVDKKIKIISQNLLKLKLIYNKQTNLEKEFSDKISDLKERDISNKKFIKLEGNNFFVCDKNLLNCKKFKILGEDKNFEKKILEGKFKDKKNLFYFISSDIYKKINKNIITSDLKIKYHGNFEELKIDTNNKKINIFTNDPNAFVIINSQKNLENWSIQAKFSTKKITNNKSKINEFGITGCVNFIDSEFKNLSFYLENCPMEDGVNFIRSKGTIDKIEVQNVKSDGVDFDFSEVNINFVNIKNAKGDCLDFSYGTYQLSFGKLYNCTDKSVSVGEASTMKIENIVLENSNIGIASKDSSIVNLGNINGKNINYCLAAFRKKEEFDIGKINYKKMNCKSNENLYDPLKQIVKINK